MKMKILKYKRNNILRVKKSINRKHNRKILKKTELLFNNIFLLTFQLKFLNSKWKLHNLKLRLSKEKSVSLYPLNDLFYFSYIYILNKWVYFDFIYFFLNMRKKFFLFLFLSDEDLIYSVSQKLIFDYTLKIYHVKDEFQGVNPFLIFFFSTYSLWEWSGEIEEIKQFFYSDKGTKAIFVEPKLRFFYDEDKFFC